MGRNCMVVEARYLVKQYINAAPLVGEWTFVQYRSIADMRIV